MMLEAEEEAVQIVAREIVIYAFRLNRADIRRRRGKSSSRADK